MFTLRFDMRAPAAGAPARELYQAAIDIAEYAETRGMLATVLCEHHGSSDGYLPAPLILASAIAARTRQARITIALILLPLYDPIRLAEEMAVLDIISAGRVSLVAGIGYVPSEYEMAGVDFKKRGKIADSKFELLLKAKTGEAFDYEGRHIHVTPPPLTPGGMRVSGGGGSVPAARRAGRLGIDFVAQASDPAFKTAYDDAAREAGLAPGNCMMPPDGVPQVVFVAEDVEAAWAELGPYLMHDVLTYGEWNAGRDAPASVSFVKTIEALRAEDRTHKIYSVAEAVAVAKQGMPLALHPLIGGLPPEIAWKYLRVVTEQVMPALKSP